MNKLQKEQLYNPASTSTPHLLNYLFLCFKSLLQTEHSAISSSFCLNPSFLSLMFIVIFFIIDVYCQTIPISFSAILSVSPAGPLAPTLSHYSRLCLTHLSLRSMQLTAPTEVLRGGL